MTRDAANANETDSGLLRRYAVRRSEEAFAELVRRHLDLVHSAALRRVGGNDAVAADVAQSVFIELSRQAGRLVSHPALAGWLYTATHRIASRHVRGESRRQRREQDASVMQEHDPNAAEADDGWPRIQPVLDDAMHELGERDRTAVVLRHLERLPYAEIASRLGIGENAARMRVERALERLRGRLAKRGITSTSTALATAISSNAVTAAPAALAPAVVAASLASITVTAPIGFLALMASTQTKLVVAIVVLAAAGTVFVGQHHARDRLAAANAELSGRLARAEADTDGARQAVARDEKELERLRSTQDELLRLRGEVARLRRGAADRTARPAASAAPAVSDPIPSRPYPPTSTVNVSVPEGHSLVTGGWTTAGGERALLIVTPTVGSADGKATVLFNSVVFEASDEVLTTLGLANYLAAPDAASPPTGTMAADESRDLLKRLKDAPGVKTVGTPRILTGDGVEASVAYARDDSAETVGFGFLPMIGANNALNLVMKVGTQPVPPAKP